MSDRRFCGPFMVEILSQEGRFTGIGQVSLGKRALRSPRHPILPAVRSVEGHLFEGWELLDTEGASDSLKVTATAAGRLSGWLDTQGMYGEPEAATLKREARSHPVATLVMEFRADDFCGLPRLQMRTICSSEDCEFISILERSTWELDGTTEGLTYFAQRWGCENGGWEQSLDKGHFFNTVDAMMVNGTLRDLAQLQPRGFGGPAMDFVYGESGAMALFREELCLVRGMVQKDRDSTVCQFIDQCFRTQGHEVATPWFSVVVCESTRPMDRGEALNWWTRLYDSFADLLARTTHIRRPVPLPAAGCESWNLGSGRFFEHQKAKLAAMAEQGIKRVMIHTLPHPHDGNNCCGWFDLSILESEGGMEALRDYTDAAGELGMSVIAWLGGFLHYKSPLVKEYPSWFTRDRAGRTFGAGYDELRVFDFVNPEVQDFLVGSVERWVREGGISGLWIDSALNAFGYGYNYCRKSEYGGPGPGVPGLLEIFARIDEMGCELFPEGVTPLGASMGNIGMGGIPGVAWTGNLNFARLNSGPEGLYRTNPWARGHDQAGGTGISEDLYFRCLANAGPLAIYFDTSDGNGGKLGLPKLDPPVAIANYAAHNRVYNEVSEWMGTRRLLPGDQGVLWYPRDWWAQSPAEGLYRHARPERVVLFSYREGSTDLSGFVPDGPKAVRLGEHETEVRIDGLAIQTNAHNVYCLTWDR